VLAARGSDVTRDIVGCLALAAGAFRRLRRRCRPSGRHPRCGLRL